MTQTLHHEAPHSAIKVQSEIFVKIATTDSTHPLAHSDLGRAQVVDFATVWQ